ncbi:MAG TPA: beta-propeller fold lactonase family protein [Candidatus Binatia bacterium]|nr:beta-propeller fold lactonase family protein [Candidatus Binatia bacterium]
MTAVVELDLRPTATAELFSTLYQTYLTLHPGTRLRAIIDTNPRRSYMGFVEAGIAHRITQHGEDEWEWSATRAAWQPMGNGPGVHHVGISPDGRRLYAVDRERTVFMIDTAVQRLTASAAVNRGTSHLAVHPRSGRVYVCERSTHSMVRLDAESLETRGRIGTGESPNLPTVAEDGSVVILPGHNGVLTVARDDEELRRTNLPIGGHPSASTISHDGRRAYVPDAVRNLLVSVDLEQERVLAETPVGDGPSHPIVTPDDRMICVANSRSHDISLVDAHTFQLLATIPSGEAAHQTTLTADGNTLLVANFFEDSVSIVDLPSRTRAAVVAVGPYPHGLDMAPGNRYAVATHFGDPWVSVIDVAGRRIAARLPAGLGSSHTTFSPEGDRAYVANSLANTITIIDLNSLEATAQIAAG